MTARQTAVASWRLSGLADTEDSFAPDLNGSGGSDARGVV